MTSRATRQTRLLVQPGEKGRFEHIVLLLATGLEEPNGVTRAKHCTQIVLMWHGLEFTEMALRLGVSKVIK